MNSKKGFARHLCRAWIETIRPVGPHHRLLDSPDIYAGRGLKHSPPPPWTPPPSDSPDIYAGRGLKQNSSSLTFTRCTGFARHLCRAWIETLVFSPTRVLYSGFARHLCRAWIETARRRRGLHRRRGFARHLCRAWIETNHHGARLGAARRIRPTFMPGVD